MKRAVMTVLLDKVPTMEVELPWPAKIINVIMGLRAKGVVAATDFLSGLGPHQPIMEEILTLVVEVDPSPDAAMLKKTFVVSRENDVVETDKTIVNRGMAISQNGSVFFVWEEI